VIEVGESGVSSLTWSPDGAQIGVVTGSVLTLWRAEDGQQTARFEQVVGHAFAPNGALLAFGLETGSIKVYDLAAAAEKYALEAPVKLGITLAFTPDSQRLVAGCDVVSDAGYMGLLKVWNMADGAQTSSVENAHKGHINAITFSADGAWMATGGKDKVAKIWTTADLQEKMAFKGHAGDIISLTFTPDAQRLATASGDGTFKFWDCVGGRELITLQDSALAAKGESCVPSRIMFSNDMRQMVVLTEPEVLAPVILHAFPWNLNEYPGEVNAELRDRVEQFKRSYWSGQ
jgi:WD40 repeat protein